ncbi:alpha/beta hydrolase [Pedobacter sp. KBW06]|uniref:alpha/beta hydrolase n=1 Tax=Pedobacter sp. KBW06 TaxID=2153359 RepID=UPI000F5B7D77|nr:alpha/beta hydrolase [Pedobacter sp. KBW06]RQO74935.1 alpha/beta hydrolase [Pedobacter sp. KBW06]
MKTRLLLTLLAFTSSIFTLSAKVKVAKDIDYGSDKGKISNQLNVYYSAGPEKMKDVLIFIHGGSWSSGKKETYWWLGRNFARKGLVTVVINYGLAPDQQYGQMAADCANAVKWVSDHIADYGGNPERIFLMGHSAGGHLAELINADPQYLKNAGFKGKISGVILNDAFGLDMNEYLSKAVHDDNYHNFLRTFTSNPEVWTKASPLNYKENIHNPHLILCGEKTYPAIWDQSNLLCNQLTKRQVFFELHLISKKKHVGMISQMIFGSNPLYKTILTFIAGH